MKNKYSNKRLLNSIIYALLLSYIIIGNLNCDWPFFSRRNPNLRLLLSKEGYSAFNPVWSPDGNKIYYLMVHEEGNIEDYGGQLRVINADGTDDRLVLDGTFGALEISSNGMKIALTCGTIWEGGELIIIDTLGIVYDTISILPRSIKDIEFNKIGNKIYYFAYNSGFYSMDIVSKIEDTILPCGSMFGFDCFDDSLLFFSIDGGKMYNLYNDSIYEYGFDLMSSWPQFSPYSSKEIVSAPGAGGEGHIFITDFTNMEKRDVNAEPYWVSYIWFPYWSPDGKKIVFSASKMRGDPNRPSNHELWILENIELLM